MSPATVLEAGAPLNQATAAVILLHGRGGSAQEMLGLAELLVAGLPGSDRWALLAPQAAAFTWYPLSFLAPRQQNEPALTESLNIVQEVVQLAGQAVGPRRVVLGGFSQGACLTTEFAATHPGTVGGLLAWTGALIGPPELAVHDRFPADPSQLAGVHAYLSSSDPDAHVPWSRVDQTAAVLQSLGATVRQQRFPGKPHNVSPPEVEGARQLLLQMLGEVS